MSDAQEEDWVIISDLDEIPNLSEIKLKNINDNFVFFKQDMMYYKFNLKLENYTWIGSKACKMKNLESPQWIRDIKDRKYSWWRVDTYFSKEPETLEWIDSFQEKENLIFWDIGANIGLYSIYNTLKNNNSKTIAFEPSTSNLRILSRNISINSFEDNV